jgi:hypothetical protein
VTRLRPVIGVSSLIVEPRPQVSFSPAERSQESACMTTQQTAP